MALQNVEANITLDLYNHDTTPSTVKAIQLDSQTRYVAARLQNMGAQYDVDSGATVQLIVVRPDKVGVQITGETFTYGDEGAQFLGPYAELTQVALAVNGKMRGQFKITSGNQILRTEIFAISTGEALDASTDEWADEYDGYNLEEMATSIETNTADIASLEADVSQIKEDFTDLPQSFDTLDEDADLYVTDEDGNAIVEFSDGHVKTKNFDSADITERVSALEDEAEQAYIPDIMETDDPDADLDITDSHGNVVARFAQGHIKTKNFDSEEALERISDTEYDIADLDKEVGFIKRVRTRMCFGAHNGAEWYAPECTIPAYRIAGQQGWEWAWIAGIYFSSEGSMYVLHDGTVDRTTDGTGSVSSMTDAQIDALNITQTGAGYSLSDFDPSELKIPTFEQVVQQCVKYGMKMVIRISDFPNGTDTAENKAKWDNFLEVLNSYGVQPEDISCYLDSGTKGITCRTLIGDDVEISTHLGQSATASDFVDWFESRSIIGRKAAILSYQNTNLEAVKLLHSHGIRVYSYGYNSQAQADNCALWGVDIYQNGRIYKITG